MTLTPKQQEPRDVHYRDKEFLYRNWHYQPGWYFYDEEEDLYGPFLSQLHAQNGLKLYITQLLAGKSPTQLSPTEQRVALQMLSQMGYHELDPDIPEDIWKSIIDGQMN
jgi:hypothetical protein